MLTAWINSAEQIADNLNSDNMNGNIMEVINYISMAIVVAGEIILAKLAWSGNCKVTFGCLFVILAAPVAFAWLVGLSPPLADFLSGLM